MPARTSPALAVGAWAIRFVRNADDPQAADVAVTVVDDWQGRGVGSELLARLSDRARQEGILRFNALVAAENVVVAGLLSKAGAQHGRRVRPRRQPPFRYAAQQEQDRPAGVNSRSLPAGCR